ncbi:MAG: hypothetical protein U5K56_21810 [Halioglobus sp.]|nr:hypothetical protein [Halioglobus sp.]
MALHGVGAGAGQGIRRIQLAQRVVVGLGDARLRGPAAGRLQFPGQGGARRLRRVLPARELVFLVLVPALGPATILGRRARVFRGAPGFFLQLLQGLGTAHFRALVKGLDLAADLR